jgi:hypothetical protein
MPPTKSIEPALRGLAPDLDLAPLRAPASPWGRPLSPLVRRAAAQLGHG